MVVLIEKDKQTQSVGPSIICPERAIHAPFLDVAEDLDAGLANARASVEEQARHGRRIAVEGKDAARR